MNLHPLTNMDDDEFDSLIEQHIVHTASGANEVPVSPFFELLFERLAENIQETISVEIDTAGNQVVLSSDRESEQVIVQGNEIIIGNRRFVFQLAPHL